MVHMPHKHRKTVMQAIIRRHSREKHRKAISEEAIDVAAAAAAIAAAEAAAAAAAVSVSDPKKRQVHTAHTRNLAIRQYMKLKSSRRVAEIFQVGKSTICRWVNQHPITKAKRTPWKKVTLAVRLCIRKAFASNPCITMATLKNIIRKTLRVHLSDECVRLTRISMGFTRKKVTRVVNKPGLHAKRMAFETERANVLPNQVISIDEASFWFDMKPGYGYSKKRRLELSDNYKKGVRWTLLLAVSNERVLGWQLYDKSTTSVTFATFLSTLELDGRDTLLMDNASIHRAQVVLDVCFEKCLFPLFLPPYSPEYQPIEHVFSVGKNMYRKQPLPAEATMQLVAARVTKSLATQTADKLGNTFDHCWMHHYQEVFV